ncbi:MAG: DUF881 domain-containing protein [Actinomycetaceae bacterium]|nr:DUF881 domain-containing protein [Actinomycetaceae bacterium]
MEAVSDGNAPRTPGRGGGRHATPKARGSLIGFLARFTVFFAAGLLFAFSATLKTPDQGRYEDNLHGLLARKQIDVQESETRNRELRATIDALIEQSPANSDGSVATPKISQYVGPGVIVTLTDAPVPEPIPPDLSPDVYVIHQQDIEAVLNALWAGGAEVIGIQGVEVRLTTEVQCVGNVININGRLFSPPYEIMAIGSATDMKNALRQDEQIQIIQGYVAEFGLGFRVKESPDIVIAAAEQTSDFLYAKVNNNE